MRGKTELENLGLAADLLQRMFSELTVLAADIFTLSRKLSDSEAEIRAGLRALNGLISLFRGDDCSQSYAQLREQAAPLIKSLSTMLDELALCAYEADLPDSESALETSNRFISESEIIRAGTKRGIDH